jgi:hypothetical protein
MISNEILDERTDGTAMANCVDLLSGLEIVSISVSSFHDRINETLYEFLPIRTDPDAS